MLAINWQLDMLMLNLSDIVPKWKPWIDVWLLACNLDSDYLTLLRRLFTHLSL